LLHVGHIVPSGLARFVKPGIERRFDGRLIPVPGEGTNEFPQGSPGDHSHLETVPCAHFGHNGCFWMESPD
jgi:hypothetical protein